MFNNLLSLRNIAFVGVLALTIFLYWPGLSGSFVLDDTANIVAIHIENPDWNGVLYNVTHNGSGMLGRSVSMLSFMLSELQFGLDPWGYKFHNLLLHIINGLLLYRLLYLLLPLLEPRILPVQLTLSAGLTTSFWLIHPLLVSTVLYAVQRMVELAVFFTLLALLSYLGARKRSCADRKFIVYGWIIFPLSQILAVLSKEIGALIPVYILILEFVVFKTSLTVLARQRHIAYWLLFFIFIPVTVGGFYVSSHFSELTDYSSRNFTLYQRLLTQLHVVAYYVKSILFPRVKDMSLFQDDFPLSQDLDAPTLLLLGALLLMLVLIWYLRLRAPVIAFGVAWFLSSHLLESTFIPLELVFEHRNYLGAIGLILIPIHYALKFETTYPQPLRCFVAIFFIVIAGQTYSRVQEWSNTGVMITVAVDEHPASSRARTEYANYLFSQRKIDETLEQLEVAMRLNVLDAGPVLHRLVVLCLRNERDDMLLAEATKRLSTWVVSPYALSAINKLMSSVVKGECTQLNKMDLEHLLLAGLSQPGNLKNPISYGSLLGFMGLHKFVSGHYQEGVNLFLKDYEITGSILVISQLARYQMELGQYDDAEDTIAFINELNKKRFGIETHLVINLTNLLEARRKSKAPPEMNNEI